MNTNRILPDALLAAYVKLGATPRRGWAYTPTSNEGHGLGVYSEAEHGDMIKQPAFGELEARGHSVDYLLGYYDGFDGMSRFVHHTIYTSGEPTADYKLGWDDGKAGWDKVKHLAREGAARG